MQQYSTLFHMILHKFINILVKLIIVSIVTRWKDAADAYLSESWLRNVMWYVKDDAKLGCLDTDQQYRLDATLKATAVSKKLLAFQVLKLYQIIHPKDPKLR